MEIFSQHVSNLPQEAVMPLIPAIYGLIADAAKQPKLNSHYTEIAANLAFRFGHDRAYRLLTDPRVLERGTNSAVRLAAVAHSRRAYNFVRWVPENHENEGERDAARDLLEAW